ncbi:MAG: hypothetical protein KIT09_27965 [Bryobacteraceae bacterium]|nr:hypothetical protein [Bryobacteraceae bacterium]
MTADRDYGCRQALEYFEALTGGETASDAKAQEHLKACSSCASELELRSRLRARLKAAVRGELPMPGLHDRVRATIRERERAPRSSWLPNRVMLAAAAMASLCIAALVVTRSNIAPSTLAAQDEFIGAMQARVAAVFGVGLGDHLHCSWFRTFPSLPGPELTSALGGEYAPLAKIVRDQVPDRFRLVIAHRCSYRGRRFVHVSMKDDVNLLSLVITDKQAGESFPASGGTVAGGIQLHHAGVDRFQVSGFETADQLVFLVSDLRPDENRNLLAALAPDVNRVLDSIRKG